MKNEKSTSTRNLGTKLGWVVTLIEEIQPLGQVAHRDKKNQNCIIFYKIENVFAFNLSQNILRLIDLLAQFPFTASELEPDY